MKKNTTKQIAIAVAAFLVTGFVAFIIYNYENKTSFKYDKEAAVEAPAEHAQDSVNAAVNADAEALAEARKNSEILKISSDDFVLGDKNAPVTMIEYASLSCPHCASFSRESFEKLKAEFVDTGKVKFAFRSFPLNQAALTAAMFASCQANANKAELPDRYYATLKALFKTQDTWAFDEKFSDKLEAIAGLDGMSSEKFRSCVTNKSLQEKMLTARMEVAKVLQIKSAPSFFVNGEISEGYVDYATLKKLIEKKLAEGSK
ncbi:MAG: DsbA family protein [Rickettsiales bacterium]|nr:DsbA family protein [Rickettsiales bacterium]